MQQSTIYSAAQGVFHSSRCGFAGTALFALGLFGLGTSMAFASGMETSAPGLVRTAMTAGAVASPAEIKNFAAAVRGLGDVYKRQGPQRPESEEYHRHQAGRVEKILHDQSKQYPCQ